MLEDSFLSYPFMQRAIIAGLLSGLACGLAGVFIILLRIAFVGVCIAHAAMAGALLCIFIQCSPIAGALTLGLLAAAGISPLSQKSSMSPDTATGIIFSVMLSISMLALGLLPSGVRIEGLTFLWGNILVVSLSDVWLLAGILFVLFSFIVLFFKEIQAVLAHREIAYLSGIPAQGIGLAMLLLLALVIVSGLKATGGLLIYSLIITPAAAAYQLTYKLSRMFFLSALFGVISCWCGLWLATILRWPSGATIVITASVVLVLSIFLSPKRRQHKLSLSH